ALRAASAAPFAAWLACPPTTPTIAPKPAPAFATPCCTQFPNASKKPSEGAAPLAGGGAGVPAGAGGGPSGPGVCAVAGAQASTITLNTRKRTAARTATMVRCAFRPCACSGIVSVLIDAHRRLAFLVPWHVRPSGLIRTGRLRQKCPREGPRHRARTRRRGAF